MVVSKKVALVFLAIVVIGILFTPCCFSQKKRFVNIAGMEFVYIAPGTFVMGSPEGEQGRKQDELIRQVRIVNGFYMQTTEVTQGQWKLVMGNNPAKFIGCGADCPVENVSWLDAQDFISRLNAMDADNEYRLPTEAEWEYACRAGTRTSYFWGDNVGPGKPLPVGSYQKNPWGLYDMHGNVWEWCSDTYAPYKDGLNNGLLYEKDDSRRVVRGGAYFDPAESCRSANRCWDPEDYRVMDIGFRLVLLPVQ